MASASLADGDSFSSFSETSSELDYLCLDVGREAQLRELRRDILNWLPSGRITDLSSLLSLTSPGLNGGLGGG